MDTGYLLKLGVLTDVALLRRLRIIRLLSGKGKQVKLGRDIKLVMFPKAKKLVTIMMRTT